MRMIAIVVLFHLVASASFIAPPLPTPTQTESERLLAQMTLPEKIGQLFMVSLAGDSLSEAGQAFIQEQHPGAIALFGYNVGEAELEGLSRLTNAIQQTAVESGAGIPLLIATDQEGGRVQRIQNGLTLFPPPLFMGAITQAEALQAVGRASAAELASVGINMNLAPVGDLLVRQDMTNEQSVMYQRTWGDDPARVGWQLGQYTQGMAQAGVVGVVKHYPGHGGSAGDSHTRLPQISLAADAAYDGPLQAFAQAVANQIPAIMVGHLYYDQLEPQANLPASLSPTMIAILRQEMGFDGVIMTDAMDMGAIANQYYLPDAALLAIQAGVDMVVTGPYLPWDIQRAMMERLILAVENGDLSEARIDDSVARILSLKAEYGLLDWQALDPSDSSLAPDDTNAALIAGFSASATALQDQAELLPLANSAEVALIYPSNFTQFEQSCKAIAPQAQLLAYTYTPADWELSYVSSLGAQAAQVVIVIENARLNARQADLVTLLPPERTAVVMLGSPYDAELYPDYSTLLALYDSSPAAQVAACHALFGDSAITGRLPMELRGFSSGAGLDVP
jgi:beta-N-acetylhexosaminidase